ncbi:hypothetical protein HPB48_002213 [Haemaphysalis longicornis]|uniref:HECT-type E3 ubiquitin transferase n=1 Tax=Haemaphysalis longicornis TaxID=44386 RepID=A0A9J6FH32_HAELO|nr:hypothetical protein HPB48_002213 [Haemaphysalis longicornis]
MSQAAAAAKRLHGFISEGLGLVALCSSSLFWPSADGCSDHRSSITKAPFHLDSALEIVEEGRASSCYSKVQEFYEQTFSSLVELNALFKENPSQDDAKLEDPRSKAIWLHAVYDILEELPTYVSKAVLKGIINSLLATDIRFSYCQYPFILSIVAKKSILQRDSEQQMILNARDVAVGLNELLSYEGNVEEDFCMNFQVSVEEFGEVKTHTLKFGGEDIPVTSENRAEYVELYVDLVLNKAIAQPFKAFYLGFHSVCASNALIMLRPEEVEMLVCGCPKLDLDELRKVTVYDSFEEDEPIIRLPVSHTCFNQLVLPKYKSKDILREKLTIAISNAEGFGLE